MARGVAGNPHHLGLEAMAVNRLLLMLTSSKYNSICMRWLFFFAQTLLVVEYLFFLCLFVCVCHTAELWFTCLCVCFQTITHLFSSPTSFKVLSVYSAQTKCITDDLFIPSQSDLSSFRFASRRFRWRNRCFQGVSVNSRGCEGQTFLRASSHLALSVKPVAVVAAYRHICCHAIRSQPWQRWRVLLANLKFAASSSINSRSVMEQKLFWKRK